MRPHTSIYVSAYYYICVRILLYMCQRGSSKLRDGIAEGRDQTSSLQQLLGAVDAKSSAHEASLERVQGMVKEVVHVIGAMSARLTEQLGTSTDPQHVPTAVAAKVDDKQMLHEERHAN